MAKKDNFKGISANQEIDPSVMWRDPRTVGQKFSDYLGDPTGFLTIMGSVLGLFFIVPSLGELWTIIGLILILKASKKEFRLPFRIPKTSGLLDPGQPHPATSAPSPAEGITFFGNERGTQKELWFNNSDMRTHVLIFGSTGAGKALRDNELIHTPNGWVKNRDLRVGDEVSTHVGTSKILGVYPQGKLRLFQIMLEDNRSIDVSGDHLWEVHNKKWDFANLADGCVARAKVLTTEKIMQELNNGEILSIPLLKKLQKPKKELLLSVEKILYLLSKKSFEDVIATENFFSKKDIEAAQEMGVLIGDQINYHIPQAVKESSWEDRSKLINLFIVANGRLDDNENILLEIRHQVLCNDIKGVLYSLGCVVHEVEGGLSVNHSKLNDIFESNSKTRKFDFFVKIKSVIQLDKEEECRCIKIADKRGLFVVKDYIVTHNTEALLSLAYNALVQGSGLIYVDGKGENVLYTKVFAMARTMGREDDVLCINYMTGARDVFGPQEKKLSNTLNPFSSGGSGGLTELIISLMDDGGGGGDMWKGRAISLISAIMMALVYMRDQREILLDVDIIRDYLILENIIKLYKTRKDFPNHIRNALRGYLVSLPGFQESAPKQNDTVMEQHGYLQMQFTRLLGSLSDQYGFIFKTNLGEVDFKDVVLNRRILVVLLPALEKSTEELANLGKIIVACLKQMMAAALGATVEGSYSEVVGTKPTNSEMPFMTVLDEYGYYAVKGSAVMPAQARSLGFSMIFAGQDFPAFKKASEEEAASIVANCNIKICMKLEDPKETYELFEKAAAEALVSSVGNLDMKLGGMATTYVPGQTASIKMEKRINMLDLRDQTEGEAHIIFKSAVIRAKMFYADPPKPPHIAMNYFVRVEPPDIEAITKLDSGIKSLIKNISNENKIQELEENLEFDNQNIIQMKNLLEIHANELDMNEASFATICSLGSSIFNTYDEKIEQFKNQLGNGDEGDDDEEINIFSTKRRSKNKDNSDDFLDDDDNDDDDEDKEGSDVFLDENDTKKSFEGIERLLGASDAGAQSSADRTMEDMRKVSRYPSEGKPSPKEPKEIMDLLDELDELFEREKEDD